MKKGWTIFNFFFFFTFLPSEPEARLRAGKERRDLGRGGEISEGRRRVTLSQNTAKRRKPLP